MERSDLRDARVLARTELRAMLRRLTSDRRQGIAAGIGLLQFAIVFPLFAFGPATDLGARLAGGLIPRGTLGLIATVAAIAGGYMGAASAFNQNRVGEVGPLIRTSVPPSAVTIGRLASELAQSSVLFVPGIVVVLVLVGIGAGGPLVPLLLALVVFPALLAGTLLGRLVGAAGRYLGALSGLSTWGRVALFLAAMVGVFLGVQVLMQSFLPSDASFGLSVSVPPLLPGRPMQAFALTVLAPLGSPVSSIGLLATLLVYLAIPLGLAATTRVETALLLREDDAEGEEGEVSGSRGVPSVFAHSLGTRIAWRHLLRTARDPRSLGHLLPLLFGALGGGVYWVTQPDVLLTVGPPGAVAFGSVLAGMLYCLNPMGDDRDQLPLLLSSVESTAVLLRGRALAGSAVGLVVAVGIGTPLAVVRLPPLYVVGQTLLAPLLLLAGAGAALGLGALFPKFERNEYMNVERAHPSQWALLGYLFGWGLLAAGGLFLLWLTVHAELSLSVALGSWIGYLVLVPGLGYGGYRYAVRRFDALTLDDV